MIVYNLLYYNILYYYNLTLVLNLNHFYINYKLYMLICNTIEILSIKTCNFRKSNIKRKTIVLGTNFYKIKL